jgi:hypothetical protein
MNVYPGTRIMRFSESTGLGLGLFLFHPNRAIFVDRTVQNTTGTADRKVTGSNHLTRFRAGSAQMLNGPDPTLHFENQKRKKVRENPTRVGYRIHVFVTFKCQT